MGMTYELIVVSGMNHEFVATLSLVMHYCRVCSSLPNFFPSARHSDSAANRFERVGVGVGVGVQCVSLRSVWLQREAVLFSTDECLHDHDGSTPVHVHVSSL